MKNKIANTLLGLLAVTQVACGGKKSPALAAFQQQCNTQACIDMYTNAAKNAGIVGPAAAASLPQVASVGAPVLPGQVTNTTLLAASVSDTQVAAQQARINSQLQAIVAAQPTSSAAAGAVTGSSTPSSSGAMGVASYSGGGGPVSVGVTRLPANDVEPLSLPQISQAAPQLTSSVGAYQAASLDNGSAMAAESSGAGAGH